MDFFDPKLSALEPYVPGEQPKDIKKLVKLNTNENPFPPSKKAIKAGKQAVKRLHLYSDPTSDKLIKAIASVMGVEKEQVAVGNGSDEVLAFLTAGFCADGMIINDITYGFYKVLANLYGVKKTVIPLKDDFSIEISDYEGKKGTVFIANPNAPTGKFLPLSEIEKLLAQDENRLVVVDEAYVDFGGESAIRLLSKYKNLVVTRTFSKSRSLAGGRLGFIVASKEIIRGFLTVKNSFHPYNVNTVTQAMATESVLDIAYFNKTRYEVIKNRAVITQTLKSLGFTVTDSMANFVFASPPDGNGKKLYEQLRARGVLVRYFDGERLSPFARITVGGKKQTAKLLQCVAEIYGK